MSTLTIISHTEHFRLLDGSIVGLGSTVTEVNYLLDVFDEIIHVAMLHEGKAPPSCLRYVSERIKFVPIPALGGTTIKSKLSILGRMPEVIRTVKSAISKSDYFQFRAPTGIGVFVIPYLVWFSSKKGWFKYAGNWQQKRAPLAYRFQRWVLINQRRKVTINGHWKNQPKHCLSFENPCLTSEEIKIGQKVIDCKTFNSDAISLCFVGRVEEEKGVGLLINALLDLSDNEKLKINSVHIVGDGKALTYYKSKVRKSNLNIIFHGFLPRNDVHNIYKQSHCIVLPSASEGFPKVISEALNYGCIPVVSDISSISHYVKNEINGFLFYPVERKKLLENLKKMINLNEVNYKKMLFSSNSNAYKFSFTYYNQRIKEEIINSDEFN